MPDDRFSLESFELYQVARQFRRNVYRIIRALPPEEKFCLASQMRRAAISVTNNIAEGHGRWHYVENRRMCRISRGSIEEVIDDLNICLDEAYALENVIQELKTEACALIKRINSYIAYLVKTKQGGEP